MHENDIYHNIVHHKQSTFKVPRNNPTPQNDFYTRAVKIDFKEILTALLGRPSLLLYSDAVLHAAGQQDQVWRLHSVVAPRDVLLNLLQLAFELVNQLHSLAVGKVLLRIVAQRNLGSTQEAIQGSKEQRIKSSSIKSSWLHYWLKI